MADALSSVPASVPASQWDGILDELERCVVGAEMGDLESLAGWAAPTSAPPLGPDHAVRASGLVARQNDLIERMRDQQSALSAELRQLRRPRFSASDAPPVYIDRDA